MTTQPALVKQTKRLFRLPFAPSDPEDVKTLVQELQRALSRCANDDHLSAVVDQAMETLAKFPAPAEIFALVREIPNPSVTKAPLGCEICQGSGWQSYQKLASPPGVDPYMADYADFCTCERGQWMRAAEKARKAEAAAKKQSRMP